MPGIEDGGDGIAAAAEELDRRLRLVRTTARGIGSDLVDGLQAAVVEGQRLDQVLAGIALDISGRFLDRSLAPLENLVAQGIAGLGGVLTGTSTAPAAGDARATTTAPAAAGDRTEAPVALTFNVSSPDAESFRRSEARLSAMLARSVGRGRRGL